MRASSPDRRRWTVLRKVDAMPLLPEAKQALRESALDLLQDPLVRGVAIWGSAGRGEPNPRDLDLVVLVPGKEAWTRRRLYCGHSIHLQMRGVARFRAMNIDRRQTRSEHRPAFADLLVLWDDTDSLATARARCRRLCARGPKPVSRWEQGRLQAELTALVEEMQALTGGPAACALHAAHVLSRCIAVHLRLRGAWVPERKGLLNALAATDEALAACYQHAISLLSKPVACLGEVRKLAAKALAPVGGMAGEYEVFYK